MHSFLTYTISIIFFSHRKNLIESFTNGKTIIRKKLLSQNLDLIEANFFRRQGILEFPFQLVCQIPILIIKISTSILQLQMNEHDFQDDIIQCGRGK